MKKDRYLMPVGRRAVGEFSGGIMTGVEVVTEGVVLERLDLDFPLAGVAKCAIDSKCF